MFVRRLRRQVAVANGKLTILREGKSHKFLEQVEHITFSGLYAKEQKQPALYVTERCVFRLSPEGVELIEVAPGVILLRRPEACAARRLSKTSDKLGSKLQGSARKCQRNRVGSLYGFALSGRLTRSAAANFCNKIGQQRTCLPQFTFSISPGLHFLSKYA